MRHFDLVILDLDGTVLDPNQEAPIRPAVKEAIQRTIARGIGVTLATGRTWEYAKHRQQELGLSLPMVSSHGASLVETNGRILWENRLPDELSQRLTREGQNLPEVCAFYFRQRTSNQLVIRQNRALRPMEVYHHLLGPETRVAGDLADYLESHQVLKFVVFDESPEAVETWSRWSGPRAHLSRTHHLLVEGTAPGVNKGAGVSRLIDHLQLNPLRVLAIGDNFNDLPMFQVVGTSVAMGQSPEPVRQAAHWVAPSFWEDGVAHSLERFVLACPGPES